MAKREYPSTKKHNNSKRAINLRYRKDKSKSVYRLNSFFTGIGGFDLGFQEVGIQPVLHCEIQEYCRTVLARHWPGVPCLGDIEEAQIHEIPEAHIWAGGFPCQDVSVARGSRGRDGLRGKRSGLFFRFCELINPVTPPKVLLIENVVGLLNSHQGRDFRVVLDVLLGLGYSVAWRVLNTRYFGAPQSRPRVFICAVHRDPDFAGYVLFEREGAHKPPREREAFISPGKKNWRMGPIVPEVAFCLAATSGRHTGTDWSRSYVTYPHRVRRLTPAECEALQGFPKGWTSPNHSTHEDLEKIDTLRYHALGNAVSVPLIRWIAGRIVRGLNKEIPPLSAGGQGQLFELKTLIDRLQAAEPSFREPGAQIISIPSLSSAPTQETFKWKNAGLAYENVLVQASIPPAPSKPIPSSFQDIIEKGHVQERYFLSPNAAEGILRRVDSQGRILFPPLRATLEYLAAQNRNAAANNKRHAGGRNG